MTAPLDVSDAPVRTPSDYGKPGMQGVLFLPGLSQQQREAPSVTSMGAGGSVQVVVAGPMFNGVAQAAMAAMVDEMQYAVASQGLANVQMFLDRSIQHPTPYYETQVTVQRRQDDWVVHDRGIAYGPWLEMGLSTTRFRGYHSFRRATEELRQQVGRILAPILARYVGRIG